MLRAPGGQIYRLCHSLLRLVGVVGGSQLLPIRSLAYFSTLSTNTVDCLLDHEEPLQSSSDNGCRPVPYSGAGARPPKGTSSSRMGKVSVRLASREENNHNTMVRVFMLVPPVDKLLHTADASTRMAR